MQVNIAEAKKDFSKLIRMIENGEEVQITVSRYGSPIASIVPYSKPATQKRIGIAKGQFQAPDDFDEFNDEILGMFGDTI